MSYTPPSQPENQEPSPELLSNNQVLKPEHPSSISINDSAEKPVVESLPSSNEKPQRSQLPPRNTTVDRWRKIEVWAIVGTLIGTLFTSIFVLYQVKEQIKATELQIEAINTQIESINIDADALSSSTIQGIYTMQQDLNKMMFDNPDFVPYFAEKKDVKSFTGKSPEEKQILTKKNIALADYHRKVIALADYHLDFFELVWVQQNLLINNYKSRTLEEQWDWDETGWAKYIQQSFKSSPILCESINKKRANYELEFVKTVLSYCQLK